MPIDKYDLEYQDFGLWRAIWHSIQDFYLYWQDRFGFYFTDETQRVRARLQIDDDYTNFTLVSKSGSIYIFVDAENGSVIVYDDDSEEMTRLDSTSLAYYDSNGTKRRVDSYLGTLYKDGEGRQRRYDECDKTTFWDAEGAVRASYAYGHATVYADTTNFFTIQKDGCYLQVNNVKRFLVENTGKLSLGGDRTTSIILEPAKLGDGESMTVMVTKICNTQDQDDTIKALRTDPPPA